MLLLTATQRIFTLTILFGNNLWNSINIYTGYILNKFGITDSDINVSFIIIGIFVFLHLLIGLVAGKFAAGMPEKIKNPTLPEGFIKSDLNNDKDTKLQKTAKKKRGKKILRKLFYVIIIVLIIFSYFHPEFGKDKSVELLIMLLRSMTIIFVWVTIISPFLYKSFRKFLDRKEAPLVNRINRIIASFPYYRKILDYSFLKYQE